jgi:hypothetical protein
MKCLCGHNQEEDFEEVNLYHYSFDKLLEIPFRNEIKMRLFACPECGTLKTVIKKKIG